MKETKLVRNRKNLQTMNKDQFVSNLNNDFNSEGLLTNADKDFIISYMNKCCNQITDSHHEILDAFMSKHDIEDYYKERVSEKVHKLEKDAVALKEYNTRLLDSNKQLHEELKASLKHATIDSNKRVKEAETKKNLEMAKLRIKIQSLQNDIVVAKNGDIPKKLAEEKASHLKTKEVLGMKVKTKEEMISLLKTSKTELISRNKEITKKLDSVEKEFRSFSKSHSLMVTKHQGQLHIQKAKNSDKSRERQEKSAQKAESFLRLQQQMRTAVVGSYHHDNSGFGGTFRDGTMQQASTNFYTQPPITTTTLPYSHPSHHVMASTPIIPNQIVPNPQGLMMNDIPESIRTQQQQQMMKCSIQNTKTLLEEVEASSSSSSQPDDFEEDYLPPKSQHKRKKINKCEILVAAKTKHVAKKSK